MQANSNNIIEGLKEAENEIRKVSLNLTAEPEESPVKENDSAAREDKQELFDSHQNQAGNLSQRAGNFQLELNAEQLVLEKICQRIKLLEKKIEERITFLRNLKSKGAEINNGLIELEGQFTKAKKENSALLAAVKDEFEAINKNLKNE